jgi:hypothetical protein
MPTYSDGFRPALQITDFVAYIRVQRDFHWLGIAERVALGKPHAEDNEAEAR